MQSMFLSTRYANDSQQVIYIFCWSRVKVNTQRVCVKRLLPIKWLLTDDIILEYLVYTVRGDFQLVIIMHPLATICHTFMWLSALPRRLYVVIPH